MPLIVTLLQFLLDVINLASNTNEKCLGAFPYVLYRRRMPVWWDQLIPVSCQLTTPRNAAAWMMTPVHRSIPWDFEIFVKHVPSRTVWLKSNTPFQKELYIQSEYQHKCRITVKYQTPIALEVSFAKLRIKNE